MKLPYWLVTFCLLISDGACLFAVEPGPTVRLIFVGDVMVDCLPGKVIERGEDPLEPFSAILSDADYTIGNLECVIATRGEAVKKPWTFRAHPRCIPLLKKHFDAVSVANNHTGDFGDDAFVEQLDLLAAAKLPTFGGGRNLREAHEPLIVELKGIRIALLGYNEFKPRSFEAGDDSPGVAWSVDEQVLADIAAARDKHHADLVIPFMHWGWELEQENDRQKELAHKMIDAGADVVVGGHPHCTQGTELYKNKLIVYSLGNFVFDGFDEPEAKLGWLLRLTLNKQGLTEWSTVVAEMDHEGVPHPNLTAESPHGKIAAP
jgi:poly-gamma-glutamate capsule biosynthesis protein CapA/YwtB (metallophosphatase superfamily)